MTEITLIYCKGGYFRWGKISRRCSQDISRGGNFQDSTPISFIKAYGFYFSVGVILARKTKAQKTRKLPPRENFHVYSTIMLSMWRLGESASSLFQIGSQNITTQSVASPRTPHLSMSRMTPIMTFTFELWPPKSFGFTMVNMSAKFDEEAWNGLICIWFTAYFCTCPLWPWPLTSDLQNQ